MDVNTRFMSGSTAPEVGIAFALEGVQDQDAKNPDHNFEPVLYVINSENSKDIRKYSRYVEEERVYVPLTKADIDRMGGPIGSRKGPGG